jgi:hypothetical protein
LLRVETGLTLDRREGVIGFNLGTRDPENKKIATVTKRKRRRHRRVFESRVMMDRREGRVEIEALRAASSEGAETGPRGSVLVLMVRR